MAGFDKSTARAIAVIALLVVAAWALRGYLPGNEQVPDRQQRPPSSAAALIFDVALLSISVAIIGIAIVVRLRNRRARRQVPGPLPGSRGGISRPTWRFWLIALALVMGWVLFVVLLTRLGLHGPVDQAPSGPPTITDPNGAPTTNANPVPRQGNPSKEPGPNIVDYLVPPMLILMALIVVGTAAMSRRGRHAAAPPSTGGERAEPSAHDAESLARAAELGLAEIGDLSREPRAAIIACYAAMEQELTHVPGAVPLDCDTPSEVLARAVGHHALNADRATRLVELFEEARFSPHVMNEGHRDIALDALRLVLADLRSLA